MTPVSAQGSCGSGLATRDIVEAMAKAINSDRAKRRWPRGCIIDGAFVDSLGNLLEGRQRLVEAWRGYYRLFPDDRIEVEAIVSTVSTLCFAAAPAALSIARADPPGRVGAHSRRPCRVPAAPSPTSIAEG